MAPEAPPLSSTSAPGGVNGPIADPGLKQALPQAAAKKSTAGASTLQGSTAPAQVTNAGSPAARDSEQRVAPGYEEITVEGHRVEPRVTMSSAPITTLAEASNTTKPVAPLKIPLGSPEALHRAAESGDLKGLQGALDQQVDINSRDEAGRTALLLATIHGQTKAVDMLLAHGADPNTADANGVTPLHAAVAGGQSAIVVTLRRAGAH